MSKSVILAILDGWGYALPSPGNAIARAKLPNLSFIRLHYPNVLLQAFGPSVGLPWGEPGNSEVGHLTMGAGRVIVQPLTRINQAIEHGLFIQNSVLQNTLRYCLRAHRALHLIGLLTASSVHAYLPHLFALLDAAAEAHLPEIYLHLFTDGRDSKIRQAPELLRKLNSYIKERGVSAQIVSLIGRNFAMDRDGNWNRIQSAYDLFTLAKGSEVSDFSRALQGVYTQGKRDYEIEPLLIKTPQSSRVSEGDAVVFFNFREDSMEQLAQSFTDPYFKEFDTRGFSNLHVISLVPISNEFPIPTLFPRIDVPQPLGAVISDQGYSQLHIAETFKHAHVTYFFNGLQEEPFEWEKDILIPSLDPTNPIAYPSMRVKEITQRVIQELSQNSFVFTLINYANPDVLAHSGDFQGTVDGIEAVDAAMGELLRFALMRDITLLISSDHGNAEALTYAASGEVESRHNLNPVPCYFVAKEFEHSKTGQELSYEEREAQGLLADIAPTVLECLGISPPAVMTGESLIARASHFRDSNF